MFVLIGKEEYNGKMLEQLSNPLHYVSISDNRAILHLDTVKEWSDKWLVQQQITGKIANWVVNLEPKAGVAFENVKTHKNNNPLRLITSCCGTAIERLSAFTEFYLKPLAQKLPAFVKDTRHLIYAKGDFNSLRVALRSLPLLDIVENELDVNSAWTKWEDAFFSAVDYFIPKIVIKSSYKPPYITQIDR
jgi:hypothetical protein